MVRLGLLPLPLINLKCHMEVGRDHCILRLSLVSGLGAVRAELHILEDQAGFLGSDLKGC